jgi:class 3 adenylate cyclase/tetratricopeptide (TPR) repeat protein
MSGPLLRASSPFTRATKVIAVADVVESVRLMELGEQEFVTRWHQFVNFVQDHVVGYSGRLHKSLGDGLMLEFADGPGCIRAVLEMQAWFRDLNQGLAAEEHVHLRIGAHVADFIADKYDIYGTDVNVAARIASLAGPGEVVISAALRERVLGTLPLHLEDLGNCHLKHVKQPVRAYRIGQASEVAVLPLRSADARGLRASVAVLPFARRGESAAAVGGETLADELVTALAKSDVLQVVSRMTTAPLDATRDTLQTVSTEVGARYVLTGRARAQADTLVMHAELADALSGDVVWADSFQPAADARGVLDGNLLSRMVAAVHGAVIQHEVQSVSDRPLPSVEGSSLLLAALGLMHRLSPVDVANARGMLEHLLDRWRRHPVTHAWLAHLHVMRVQQSLPGFTRQDEALARAHAAASVQADPTSVLGLAIDGHASVHCASNMEAAAERFAQALRLQPDHSLAQLFHAEWLALQGSGRAARHAAAQALDGLALEPLRYLYDAIGALAALASRDAEEAVVLAQQSVQRNPRYLPAWRTLLVAQVESERLGEARCSQQQVFKRQPAFSIKAFAASVAMGEEMQARFARALARAGTPEA